MTATGRSRLDVLRARAAPVLEDGDAVELTPRGRRERSEYSAPTFQAWRAGRGERAQGRPGFDDRIGLEERAVGDGRARIVMVAGEGHLNPAGAVHGGAIATLVDVAMGKAVASTISDAELPVTIEMKVNFFLEPGRPGLLIAAAEVRRRGRLFTVVTAEVTQDEDGETVAEAMGTFTSTG